MEGQLKDQPLVREAEVPQVAACLSPQQRDGETESQRLLLGDDEARRLDFEANPHVWQTRSAPTASSRWTANDSRSTEKTYQSRSDLLFERTLSDNAPRTEYRRRRGEEKTVLHWGQRKLLLSEVEFLTEFAQPGTLVVYAGAAPGTHTPLLMDMFPECRFVLVDPAPFSKPLLERNADGCLLVENLFTDSLARMIRGNRMDLVAEHCVRNSNRAIAAAIEASDNATACPPDDSLDILFISDIRAAEAGTQGFSEVEDQVGEDMTMQWNWVKLLKPRASMLKLRFPWQAGKTVYADGRIALPIWGPITTTETRLIITDPSGQATREYDNSAYEEQMFHFNTVTRVARYPHAVHGEGIDHCYDCTAECHVLFHYLRRFPDVARRLLPGDPKESFEVERKGSATSESLQWISRFSAHISRKLGKRTLVDGNPDAGVRQEGIKRSQFRSGVAAHRFVKKQIQDSQERRERYEQTGSAIPGASKFMKMMKNYAPGTGLGAQQQGAVVPVAEELEATQGRGLGYGSAHIADKFSEQRRGAGDSGYGFVSEAANVPSVSFSAPSEQERSSRKRRGTDHFDERPLKKPDVSPERNRFESGPSNQRGEFNPREEATRPYQDHIEHRRDHQRSSQDHHQRDHHRDSHPRDQQFRSFSRGEQRRAPHRRSDSHYRPVERRYDDRNDRHHHRHHRR